jgi:hypothetical protein
MLIAEHVKINLFKGTVELALAKQYNIKRKTGLAMMIKAFFSPQQKTANTF